MDRLSLKAQEREILGKKVKSLRQSGLIPAHVFGKKVETEHVSVQGLEFLKVYKEVGETGLIDLKIGAEKIRPVMVKGVQVDPVRGFPLHIDFYQVNLSEKVQVPVPIEIIGEEPEVVHSGEAVVIQPLSEVEVEALPTEIPEKLEVDISSLRQVDDAILVSSLKAPEGVTILGDPEAVVVKLDTAITEEMKQLLEEEAAASAAAAAEAVVEGGAEEVAEGEAVEGEAPVEGETPASAEATAGKPAEGQGHEDSKGEKEQKEESSENK
ncbi:MAG: 50S ribosomal protein L25 [Candidatus Daviesbacteria bacterium]